MIHQTLQALNSRLNAQEPVVCSKPEASILLSKGTAALAASALAGVAVYFGGARLPEILSNRPITTAVTTSLLSLWFLQTPIVSDLISSKTNMDVSMGSTSLGPYHTKITDLKIMNPPGMKREEALTCEKIQIDHSPSSLAGAPTVIDRLELEGLSLNIECLDNFGTKYNWTQLVPKKEGENEGELIIKKLVLNNFTTEVQTKGAILPPQIYQHKIDHIEFENVSTSKGVSIPQLIANIFKITNINPVDALEGASDRLKTFFQTS